MTAVPIRVRPRREGDPVPDLTGLRVAHRVMLRDADRLARLARRITDGGPLGPRRVAAICAYVRDWAESVHAHHAAEGDLLWPLLTGSAGPRLDLGVLRDDHAALGPALDRLHRASDAFGAGPDEDTGTALAVELAELRDALHEQVADEEATVLPALERYVSVRDWRAVQSRIARRTRLRFDLPRMGAVLTAEERAALPRTSDALLRLAAVLLGPGFRRRECLVFG